MKTILLQLFKDTKIDLTKACLLPDSGSGDTASKFDLTPKNFLRFAKQDLKEEDDRGIINSLTNSKRAIDCQTDEAFEKCGIKSNDFDPDIKKFVEHFDLDEDVPIKLKIIHSLNLAPSILISKTRTLRNKLEHFYQKPNVNEAKEALDVADLFIRSVEGKFNMLITDFYLTDEKNYDGNNHWDFKSGLSFSFDTDKRNFLVRKIGNTKIAENFKIDCNYIEYYGLLRLMFSIGDDIDLDETLKILLKQLEHPMPTEKVSLIQA
jgi:hypothetical protein